MNIKEFEVVRKKPFDSTLVFELFEGSDFDKKSYKVINANDDLFTETKMNNEVFRYNITNKTSLRKYLSLRMDKETILYIVRRMLAVEKYFVDNGLDQRYIMFDSDLVLVDKDSEEVTFITVPASDHGLLVKPLRAFIKEVVANAIYDEDENLDFVGRLLTYVNSHREINIEELENVLKTIEAFDSVSKIIEQESVDMPAKEESLADEIQEALEEVAVAEIPLAVVEEVSEELPETLSEEVVLEELPEPVIEEIQPLEEIFIEEPVIEEIVLHEEESVPVPVPEPAPVHSKQSPTPLVPTSIDANMQRPPVSKAYPYIVRTKTQEVVAIDREEFKIGKISGMADYLLSDNPAVSRMHAIIHNTNGNCYICDNYSTNGTFLNGERLEPGRNYLLLNGARLLLANEEFTYLYQQRE